MRKTTKTVVGILSLGVMGTSWSLGQAAETGISLTNTATPTSAGSETTNVAGPPTGTTASPSPTPSASASASETPAPTASKQATSAKSVSKTGDAVTYKVQGYTYQIQLSVTKKGSDITDVGLVIAEATNFGDRNYTRAFPYLQEAALAADSASFGNVGGATFTSKAFKQALDNALAKF